ncbi:unnamed protein product [Owenia fusiformis]|uniref:Uncharacterized protein n=1 Tax=Owenia fusiformis TaxID=6347 RepID=A0A8J1U7M0_OWEFU|nr:unnamed protein product [Owenia fusiformis]
MQLTQAATIILWSTFLVIEVGGVRDDKESESSIEKRSLQDVLRSRSQSNHNSRTRQTEDVPVPQCHVEVEEVRRIPGRCTQLGRRRIPACVAGGYLYINNGDCISSQ